MSLMAGSKAPKIRLDVLLVEQGLCETRSQAQSLILSGKVLINEQVVDKAGTLCDPETTVRLKEKLKYVSRGGLKLEAALQSFQTITESRICLDAGASTGGFTDCLLQSGAVRVYAVDVGYGQLDWKIRQDERVVVFEKTHINTLQPEQLSPSPSLAVVDVSFISLKKVIQPIARLLQPQSELLPLEIIALVKPQFEYMDYCQPKGFNGVVTRLEDLETILTRLFEDLALLLPDWDIVNAIESPIKGPKGNREFLIHLTHRKFLERSAMISTEGETTAPLAQQLLKKM